MKEQQKVPVRFAVLLLCLLLCLLLSCTCLPCNQHKQHSDAMLDHVADRMLTDSLHAPATVWRTWAPLLGQHGVLVLQSYLELGTGLSSRLNGLLTEALEEVQAAMTGALTALTAVEKDLRVLQRAHAVLARHVAMGSWHALVAGPRGRLIEWVRAMDATVCIRRRQ